jgi:hypothetical protein
MILHWNEIKTLAAATEEHKSDMHDNWLAGLPAFKLNASHDNGIGIKTTATCLQCDEKIDITDYERW